MGDLSPITARSVPDHRLDILNRSPLLDASVIHVMEQPPGAISHQAVANGARRRLSTAPLWWVSPDMVDLLEAAAPQWKDQPLTAYDPPSHEGLVFFGKPIIDDDTNRPGEVVPTEAILWSEEWMGGKVPVLMILTLYRVMGTPGHLRNNVDVGGWVVSGANDWDVGTLCADGKSGPQIADRKRIAALWTLTQQEGVADVSHLRPDRQTRRRSDRARLPPDASDTRIVNLRRPARASSNNAAPGSVNYSHRWIVSGHWHPQWFPKHGEHRLQWRAPYVKGPADKPLVVRETVRAWTK